MLNATNINPPDDQIEALLKTYGADTIEATTRLIEDMKKSIETKRRREEAEAEHFEQQHHRISFIESENRYYVRYNTEEGVRKKYAKSKTALLDWLVKYRSVDCITVDKVFHEWISYRREFTRIKEQTLSRYLCTYKTYVEGTEMSKTPISTVLEDDIHDWFDERIKTFQMTAKDFSMLKLIVRGTWMYARKRKITTLNISDVISYYPTREHVYPTRPRKRPYSDEEICRLIAAFKKKNDLYGWGLILMIETGIRIGELLALTWDGCDVENGIIRISKTLIEYSDPYNEGHHVWEVQESPKTATSNRELVLTNEAEEALLNLYELTGKHGCTYVIEKNGRFVKTTKVRGYMKRVCERNGITYRATHASRYNYATMLLRACDSTDISHDFVRAQLGHSDIMTTERYYDRDSSSVEKKREVLNHARMARNVPFGTNGTLATPQ